MNFAEKTRKMEESDPDTFNLILTICAVVWFLTGLVLGFII